MEILETHEKIHEAGHGHGQQHGHGGLPPNAKRFTILISLAVWSELWGIPGAFLAVPITAIMTIVFSEFPGTRPIAVLLSKTGRI